MKIFGSRDPSQYHLGSGRLIVFFQSCVPDFVFSDQLNWLYCHSAHGVVIASQLPGLASSPWCLGVGVKLSGRCAVLDGLIFLGQWRCPQWVPSQGIGGCFPVDCAVFPWLAGALTTLPGSATDCGSMVITLVSRSLVLGEPPLNVIRPLDCWDY